MKIPFLIKISSLLILVSIIWQCNNGVTKQNIKAYYFPLESLKEGKVYEYQAVNDSLAPFYWYFRTTILNGETILTSEYFDHNFIIQQLTNEIVVKNGVLLKDFFLYETDTLTDKQIQNPVSVEVDNVFPFEVSDSTGLFLYKVFWKDRTAPYQKYRLIKNRHFMGHGSFNYKDKKVDCVRFLNKELLEIEAEGFQEVRYNSIELYAKNIGLLYFRKEIDDNIVQEYQLADIYEMTELEEKFRKSIQ